MALSNIFREPRREITESVVGIAIVSLAVALLIWPDYYFAVWWRDVTGGDQGGCPVSLGMIFFGPLALFGIAGAAIVTHALGDGICNALQDRGIHLRPRVRR